MRTKILLLSLTLAFAPFASLAENSLSSTTQEVATTKLVEATQHHVEADAVKHIQHLVSKKVIDVSWQSEIVLESIQSEKKIRDDHEVWVVHFKNKNWYKNPAKKKLYIFFKLSGDYLIANFSGK